MWAPIVVIELLARLLSPGGGVLAPSGATSSYSPKSTRVPWISGNETMLYQFLAGWRRAEDRRWKMLPLEEFSDSAWRSSKTSEERESRPKEKGTPLRGGCFYLWTRPPFFLANCRRK